MLGLKRRKRVEGWALDVAETDREVGRSTPAEKLADNNKLWIICLIAVLAVSLALLRFGGNEQIEKEGPRLPADLGSGHYDDSEHKAFAKSFVTDKRHGTTVLAARFVSREVFRIDVPANASKDDIEYAARYAGDRIVTVFNFRAVIEIHGKSVSGDSSILATARWEPESYGFVVKFSKTD